MCDVREGRYGVHKPNDYARNLRNVSMSLSLRDNDQLVDGVSSHKRKCQVMEHGIVSVEEKKQNLPENTDR